jgi:hypothetical protein
MAGQKKVNSVARQAASDGKISGSEARAIQAAAAKSGGSAAVAISNQAAKGATISSNAQANTGLKVGNSGQITYNPQSVLSKLSIVDQGRVNYGAIPNPAPAPVNPKFVQNTAGTYSYLGGKATSGGGSNAAAGGMGGGSNGGGSGGGGNGGGAGGGGNGGSGKGGNGKSGTQKYINDQLASYREWAQTTIDTLSSGQDILQQQLSELDARNAANITAITSTFQDQFAASQQAADQQMAGLQELMMQQDQKFQEANVMQQQQIAAADAAYAEQKRQAEALARAYVPNLEPTAASPSYGSNKRETLNNTLSSLTMLSPTGAASPLLAGLQIA